MQLFDTHTHIFTEDFNPDRVDAVNRAKSVGVMGMVLPNIDSQSISSLISAAEEFPGYCFPCMGLHPTSVKANFERELEIVEGWFQKYKFYGVGEIGIDLYWDKTYLEQQKEAFRYQLQLAKRLNLPVIIHARNSFDEILSIVDQENDENLKGVFHSFSGDMNCYRHIIEYGGFMIGIGGVVTYKNGGVDTVVGQMDINHTVLETDSPYLSPVPRRGKRNESSNLIYTATKVAELLNYPVEQVGLITTRNACNLFSIELD